MKPKTDQILLYLSLAVVFIGAIHLNYRIVRSTNVRGQDIQHIYMDGKYLLNGQNTYSRIRGGDMRQNKKYATFFPLFYCASAITQIPLPEFDDWIQFWRVIFVLFNIAIGASFAIYAARRGKPWAGVFAAALWFANRWTITLIGIGQIDLIPIFFVILSLMLFDRYRKVSMYLFGLSLAIKQIAIFLGPLYLIWSWNEENDPIDVVKDFLRIIAIPLLVSIPFLIWDGKSMIFSILFSATRNPSGHFGAPSFDQVYQLVGLDAKLPMLAAMAGVFWFAYCKQLGRYAAAFMVILCFTLFNSVLFRQYLVWPMAFLIPWVLAEIARRQAPSIPQPPEPEVSLKSS